jgi:hypothetical protein
MKFFTNKVRYSILAGLIFLVSVLLYVFVMSAMGQCNLPLTFCTNFYESVLGGGSIDLDPDLSPSYALDFASGLFYHTIVPLVGLIMGISALFLVPFFILKRKNIPSRPYLVVILAGLLLFLGIPNFVASLQTFAILFSQPEQIRTWVFDPQFIALLMPIIVSIIAGVLLYKSSVVRKLIKK